MKTIELVVHTFMLSDAVEDPTIYAAEPLMDWQNSDVGKWVMANSIHKPKWHRSPELTYVQQYYITAIFTEKDYIYFNLRFK